MNYYKLVGVLLYLFVFAICIVALTQPIATASAKSVDGFDISAEYYANKFCYKFSYDFFSISRCNDESANETFTAILALLIIMLVFAVSWIIACITNFNKVKHVIGVLLFLTAVITLIILALLNIKQENVDDTIIIQSSIKKEVFTTTTILTIVTCCLVIVHQIIDFPMVNRLIFKTA